MKRITLIFLLFVLITSLAGCGNSDLESKRNELQAEIETLQSEVDSLKKVHDGLIQKDSVIYVLELEISQSHFTLDIEEHLKDSMNKLTIPIQVSEEYYYSVKEGDILSDEFRAGSFWFKGSIGNWKIKVKSKKAVCE